MGSRGRLRLSATVFVVASVAAAWPACGDRREAEIEAAGATMQDTPPPPDLAGLSRERRSLEARLRALGPRGAYIVVDRGNNRIYLRTRDRVVVDASVSTGSHSVLKETEGQRRTWVFETPPGRFVVKSERADPIWTRPDWAFLETGEPIPDRVADRREYGSLGEYALDLGDGYMIHGTLYERLLGRSVTHGCVRVGRDALRAIVSRASVGTPVFIY